MKYNLKDNCALHQLWFFYVHCSLVYSRYANCKNRLGLKYILSGVWSPTDWREYGISQQSSYAALHNSGFPFPQGGGGGGDLSTVQGFRYRRGGGLADFFNVYPENASLIKRFVLYDPKRNEPNLTPKSKIYIFWKRK
jgi:hypothetical protein